MTSAWLAVLSAGLAAWWWCPPDPVGRLAPRPAWRLPAWAQPLPEALGSRQRWWVAAGLAVAVVAYGWDKTWAVVLVAPLVAVAAWVLLGRLEPAGTRDRRLWLAEAVPEALDLIQACVRAGQPLRQAVATVTQIVPAPVAARLKDVTQALAVGLSDDQAWRLVKDDPVWGAVARDLARCAAWGTPVHEVLASHAADLRRQAKAGRLSRAKSAGVRAVLPLGVCYLPAFMLLGVVPILAGGLALILTGDGPG